MGLFDALGLSGQQGDYMTPGTMSQFRDTGVGTMASRNRALTSTNTQNALYKAFGGDVAGAMADIQNSDMNAEGKQAAMESLKTSPISGEKATEYELQNSALGKPIYGEGGLYGQTTNAAQSYLNPQWDQASLQKEDVGLAQAMANQDRAEKNAAVNAAQRGQFLGGGNIAKGALQRAAGTDLNLRQMQTQISDDRFNRAQQMLNQANQMAGQGSQMEQGIYNRAMAGRQQGANELNNLAGAETNSNNAETNRFSAQTGADYNSNAQKAAMKSPTLGQAFGAGLLGGVSRIGGSLSMPAGGTNAGTGDSTNPLSGTKQGQNIPSKNGAYEYSQA